MTSGNAGGSGAGRERPEPNSCYFFNYSINVTKGVIVLNGFKVICLACGKETVFTQDQHGHIFKRDNDIIDFILIGYNGEMAITCDCGVTIEAK